MKKGYGVEYTRLDVITPGSKSTRCYFEVQAKDMNEASIKAFWTVVRTNSDYVEAQDITIVDKNTKERRPILRQGTLLIDGKGNPKSLESRV